jgi:hypothetical protein
MILNSDHFIGNHLQIVSNEGGSPALFRDQPEQYRMNNVTLKQYHGKVIKPHRGKSIIRIHILKQVDNIE